MMYPSTMMPSVRTIMDITRKTVFMANLLIYIILIYYI